MASSIGKSCRILINFKPQSRCYKQVRKSSSDLLYSLLRRGLVKQIFPNDQLINCAGTPCAYAGFDATADSLHIGNLLVLIGLVHWQRAGFDTIAVIGDTTAEIGDPSGHKADRNVLSRNIVHENAASIENNIHNIFQNHENYILPRAKKKGKPLGKLRILRNSEWYQKTSIVDFISQAGRELRIGDMLSRTRHIDCYEKDHVEMSLLNFLQVPTRATGKWTCHQSDCLQYCVPHPHNVKLRMENGSGINFSEFSYQVFQSYDWLHLCKTYNCRFQFGGNDQLGNIMSGYNLVSGSLYHPVYGAVLPLIQSESGDKFGKSAGNAVWLTSQQTSPFELYQFFMRIQDADVNNYLKLFTFLKPEEIEDLVQRHMKSPDSRRGQKKIAEEVTLLVHGEQGLNLAEAATKILFQSNLESLAELNVEDLNQVFPLSTISQIFFEPGISILDLTMKVGCFKTKDDADRIIKGGGVYLNFERISLPQFIIIPEQHILSNGISLIRIGKKTYYVVNWKS